MNSSCNNNTPVSTYIYLSTYLHIYIHTYIHVHTYMFVHRIVCEKGKKLFFNLSFEDLKFEEFIYQEIVLPKGRKKIGHATGQIKIYD